MKTSVYFDYAATTPADPAIVAVMTRYLGLDGAFGNPASRLRRQFREPRLDAVESAAMAVRGADGETP